MPTKWVVTTPSDHIEIDEAHQAETTFTVTNPTTKVDRVVFDVVAGDGADTSWFSIDQPQRRVPPSGSVSYLLKTAIPADAPAGTYAVQGRAYSADSAPEEDSVLSSRLVIQIAAKAKPAAKKRLPAWWIYVVIGLVVVVALVVVGIKVFGGAKDVTAPDVTHEPLNQAKTNLAVFGLNVGTIRYQEDASGGVVVSQSAVGGEKTSQDTPVDLVVTATLVAPTPGEPSPGATVAPSTVVAPTAPIPTNPAQFTVLASPSPSPSAGTDTSGLLKWTDTDSFVTHWQVTIQQRVCTDPASQKCAFVTTSVVRVDQPSYTPIVAGLPTPTGSPLPGLPPLPTPSPSATVAQVAQGVSIFAYTTYQWSVAAVDDFGNAGPASPFTAFVVH